MTWEPSRLGRHSGCGKSRLLTNPGRILWRRISDHHKPVITCHLLQVWERVVVWDVVIPSIRNGRPTVLLSQRSQAFLDGTPNPQIFRRDIMENRL